MIRVGPAGWSYADWQGRVYPRSKPRGFHPLAHLARFVECVEINSTFYADPHSANAARWCELVADKTDFRFVAKLLKEFTHAPEPADPARWEQAAARWLAGLEPLRRSGRLSCVLVQFPVSFLFGPAEVRRLGHLRQLFSSTPLVLEVRHQSWFAPPALDALRGLDYSVAYIDLPSAWNHPPPWHRSTGPIGYLRLHGRNASEWFRRGAGRDDRYDYLYAPAEVRELADKARRIAGESEDLYVITNNHFEGQAVANALELIHLLHEREPLAPVELVEAFPHLADIARVEGQRDLFG